MIVDSTALPEQVVRDVLASAFQSAGQRCSALRVLYIQEEIADELLAMLYGAMDQLTIGNPWTLKNDIGPVIDKTAQQKIINHCNAFDQRGRILKTMSTPAEGVYVAPTVLQVSGIEELGEEIFGPILHVATFKGKDIDKVVETINAQNYGLTFGLHSRVDSRVQQLVSKIHAGNAYVNRNQIGAIVGSQPFGGEGLSGTGPKAGGPHYLKRFLQSINTVQSNENSEIKNTIATDQLQRQLSALSTIDTANWSSIEARHLSLKQWINGQSDTVVNIEGALKAIAPCAPARHMPGPTGELNVLRETARGAILCIANDINNALQLALSALSQGNSVLVVVNSTDSSALYGLNQSAATLAIPINFVSGVIDVNALTQLQGFSALLSDESDERLRQYKIALAERTGALIPIITECSPERFVLERHLCVDTTAAGGNASLIATVED